MFEVVYKVDESVYKVYDVLNKQSRIWFLVYRNNKWEYMDSIEFIPYVEIY